MSSHIDRSYTTRLKAMITVIASMESVPRTPVRVITQPYRRFLTFWQMPETKETLAVPFEEFHTPARERVDLPAPELDTPVPYVENPSFPSVPVRKGLLAQNDKGVSVILCPARHMGKELVGVYREVSIEDFLSRLTVKAKHREECVWQTFGQFLHDYHQFKCTYRELQQQQAYLQKRGRHKGAKSTSR